MENGTPTNPLMIRGVETLNMSKPFMGAFVHSFLPKTVIFNTTVPKHYAYDFSSDKFETDSVAHFLDREEVQKVVVDGLTRIEFIESIITKSLGVRSGIVDTSVAISTFDLLQLRVADVLTSSGLPATDESIAVTSSMFVDLFNKLNLMLISGKVRALETRRNLLPGKSEILAELRRMHLRVALDGITMDKLNIQKKVSVAALVQAMHPMFLQLARAVARTSDVDRAFEDVLVLIKLYNTNDRRNLSRDELGIFDDPDFLDLAHNFTLAEIALSTVGKRPKSGAAYWSRMIEKVSSLLKSSDVFQTSELSAIKEYFTVEHIKDQTGLKRGLIISKNLAERQPFQVFKKLQESGTSDALRLDADVSCENAFSGIYDAASTLTSQKVHSYVSAIMSASVTAKTDYFFFGLGVTDRELQYLAAAYNFPMELVSNNGNQFFAYRIDETNSLIKSEMKSVVRISKTADPRIALLYAAEPVEGKKVLAFVDKPITETRGFTFLGTKRIFTQNFSRSLSMTINLQGANVNVDWDLESLSGVSGLKNVVSIAPIIGREVFTALINSYSALINWAAKGSDVNRSFFETNATIGLTSVLKPILTTRDVEDMLSTSLGQIWTVLAETEKNEDVLSSVLGADSLKAELKVRLTLFVMFRLGFLSTEDEQGLADIKDTIRLFKQSGAFNVISMEMAR